MIGILLGFQIENQRWKAKHSERSRSKNSALEAGCSSIAQDFLRRSSCEAEIIWQFVKKALDARWCLESTQRAQLRARKTGTRRRRCRSCSCSAQSTKSHHSTSKQTPITQIPTTRSVSDLGKIGAWSLGFGIFRGGLQSYRVSCFEAPWQTIGGLPARSPAVA